MEQPDVETLVAYANHALPPDRARQIERYVAGNSEVQRLIETFRRRQGLGRPAARQPRRQARQQAVPSAGPKPPSSESGAGVAAAARKAGRLTKIVAVAASMVTIAGLGAGALFLRQDAESPLALGRLSSIDALSAALSRLASGAPGMAGDRAVTVLASFRDTNGRACRLFEMSDTSPTASRVSAVACQEAGAWRVEGATSLMAGESNGGGELILASTQGDGPLAALLKRLGPKTPLTKEEEAALMARNWQPEAGPELAGR